MGRQATEIEPGSSYARAIAAAVTYASEHGHPIAPAEGIFAQPWLEDMHGKARLDPTAEGAMALIEAFGKLGK